MVVETRKISDLADPSVDNSVADTQLDYSNIERRIKDINTNQEAFTPDVVPEPYKIPNPGFLAGLIVSKVLPNDDTDYEYNVLRQDRIPIVAETLNHSTIFENGDEVIVAPPLQGETWIIVSEKLHHQEENVRIKFTFDTDSVTLEVDEEIRLKSTDFETIVGNTVSVPAGYYDIRVQLRETLVPVLVTMTQTGGAAGDKTTQCSYTYTVKNFTTGETLATAHNPANSYWKRPTYGRLQAATYGLWRRNGITWCNEALAVKACP